MKPNYPNFKRSLHTMDKRDIQYIKHGVKAPPHDQIIVSKLRKRERIKDRKAS